MASHRDAFDGEASQAALPAQPSTCSQHAPDPLPAQDAEREAGAKSAARHFPLPEQSRTEQSLRAEASFKDWSDVPDVERPLARTRSAHAAALFRVLKDHDISILRFAGMLEVNERQARKYLEARAPIPSTIFDALPRSLADDFAKRIGLGARGSAADRLRAALEELKASDGITDDLILQVLPSLTRRGGR